MVEYEREGFDINTGFNLNKEILYDFPAGLFAPLAKERH